MGTEKTCAGRSNGAALFRPKHEPFFFGDFTHMCGYLDWETGFIFAGRAPIRGGNPDKSVPCLQVSNRPATVADIEARTALAGNDTVDLTDEFRSCMWFTTRKGLTQAFDIAKTVVTGGRFEWILPLDNCYFKHFVLSASIHHITPPAPPVKANNINLIVTVGLPVFAAQWRTEGDL